MPAYDDSRSAANPDQGRDGRPDHRPVWGRWASRAHPDRLLLALSAGFMVVHVLSLLLLRPDDALLHVAAGSTWLVLAVGATFLLDRYLPARDRLIFPSAMLLSGWGLLIIDRLMPAFAARQIIWLALSVGAMLVAALLPQVLRWLRAYRYTWLLFGLILLVATILFGRNPSGMANAPELWLGIGSLNFQPSELLKVILVVFLASYLAEAHPSLQVEEAVQRGALFAMSPRVLGPVLLMWGLSVIVLVWQRDLGAAALFFIVFLTLMAVASGNWRVMAGGLLLFLGAGIAAYQFFDIVRLRVDIWLNPWPRANDASFQIVQSLQAFAAGGIFGQGIGQGSPYLVPVAHSDFAFSALAEEWGLLGVVVVLAVLALLVMRGLLIALQPRREVFNALLAAGISTLLAAQSLLIMGGVLGIVPLTGVTLPFLSYGGSSLLVSFLLVGLLLRLSVHGADHPLHDWQAAS